MPLLLKNSRDNDECLSLSDLYSHLFYDKIREEVNFEDGLILKRLIVLNNGAKILLRINELSDIKPFAQCVLCDKIKDCREGIFSIRILADGTLLPCLEEGIERIDLKNAIINRDNNLFKNTLKQVI